MFQSDLDSGFCSGPTKNHQVQGQGRSRTASTSPSSSPSPPPPTATEAAVPSWNGFNKRGSSAMDSGKPPRPVETGAGIQQCNSFPFGVSTLLQASDFCIAWKLCIRSGARLFISNIKNYYDLFHCSFVMAFYARSIVLFPNSWVGVSFNK
jgi:hypothetical protein